MYLYEIEASLFSKHFSEAKSNDIDTDLAKTAKDISKVSGGSLGDTQDTEFNSAPDPEEVASPLQQSELEGDLGADGLGGELGGAGLGGAGLGGEDELGADPELGSEESEAAADELLTKKIDSLLFSAIKGKDYVKKYRHEEGSKIHPLKIASLPPDELYQLRNMVKNKINMGVMSGDIGSYHNEDMNFFNDLMSFVDDVIDIKKEATKERTDQKAGKTAKFEKREKSPNQNKRNGKPNNGSKHRKK